MYCYYCGAPLGGEKVCPGCLADVRVWKKIASVSNRLYNDGLAKAQVRDLSGAIEYLKMSLRYNKANIDARNLLGLIYFEMGETVNALSEWVISKSLLEEDNLASDYLFYIQRSSARQNTLDQTVKKFNQALSYCHQGNDDLAVIQLKKVLSLNPRMVKAHQLLALLYMKADRYDLANRTLKIAARIDTNNTNTMLYMKECRNYLRANGKLKNVREDDTVTYQSGNDIIIRPAKFIDNTAVMTVVNLLIGAAIGIAVVCFLIIPGVRYHANSAARDQVVEANETVTAREQKIQTLESQIDDLNRQLADAQSETTFADEKAGLYEQLMAAYLAYEDERYTEAGESLKGVDREALNDGGKSVYDKMFADVQQQMFENSMKAGVSAYEDQDYENAVNAFSEIVNTDPAYDNGRAAYYLAMAYADSGDRANALTWFQTALEHTDSGSTRRNCQQYIRSLQQEDAAQDPQQEGNPETDPQTDE